MQSKIFPVAAALVTMALAAGAHARDQIHIVGSSTVYPFATAVAEEFAGAQQFKAPVVESTGSGAGIKLFCAGVGVGHPDITNSSRRIKKAEVETCAQNGVTAITEVKIGYDGIVVARTKQAPAPKLTLRQIYLALAKVVPQGGALAANPYKLWSDIDPALPKTKIEVLGPPPTSGTRDAFVELAMEGGCTTFPELADLNKTDEKAFKAACHGVREDGAYVDAGENDNVIVKKLEANPNALGVFGYSFLDQNRDKVHASVVNDAEPSFENIVAGKYPVSRSIYFYVKNAHVGVIPGIAEYVDEFTSEKAMGENGYLLDKGLIPLQPSEHKAVRDAAKKMVPLTM
ncbi:MAG: PstS family phosphate ABC transporter substrate-binding protein [Alphaproteobacteria bacterium]